MASLPTQGLGVLPRSPFSAPPHVEDEPNGKDWGLPDRPGVQGWLWWGFPCVAPRKRQALGSAPEMGEAHC